MKNSAGRILQIWRHAASSVGGERLRRSVLRTAGLDGDRVYALIDVTTGRPASPETDARWRKALHLKATGTILAFPSGLSLAFDDPTLTDVLTEYFGFAAALAPYGQSRGASSYRLQNRYSLAPVHLITTSSVSHLSALCGAGPIDPRRFRPSVLIDTSNEGRFVEDSWIGRRISIGSVELYARENTRRCGMTLLSQPGLGEEPTILRTLLRHNNRNFGIYCDVVRAGSIEVGDNVVVED